MMKPAPLDLVLYVAPDYAPAKLTCSRVSFARLHAAQQGMAACTAARLLTCRRQRIMASLYCWGGRACSCQYA